MCIFQSCKYHCVYKINNTLWKAHRVTDFSSSKFYIFTLLILQKAEAEGV